MNRENLLRVADAIEKHAIPSLGFNMECFVGVLDDDESGRGCGTVACGAGWAVAVRHEMRSAEQLLEFNERGDIETEAAAFLELTYSEGAELFFTYWVYDPVTDYEMNITPAMAAATYRYAAEHGVVDWEAACAPLLTESAA